jgi:hypothetical protein
VALSDKQKEFVLGLSRNPKSLQHQARLFLRQYMGKKLPKCAKELGLPRMLVHYLLFEVS